jgi:hypothetical protein
MEALVAHVTADAGNRIVLPKHLCERVPWLARSSPVSAWVYLISPGRMRILSDEEVKQDPLLEPIRSLIVNESEPPKNGSTMAEDLTRAAFVARLVPVSLTLPSTGWRVPVPRVFETYLPLEYNRRAFSVIFSVEGYLEIWYTQLLCNILSDEKLDRKRDQP